MNNTGDVMREYGDIIDLPHHVSSVHPRMPVSGRAAQFAPFAALTGYGDVIQEAARQTDMRPELSEDAKEMLDHKLREVCDLCGEKPYVTITYFVPDEKKAGGAFHKISGKILKADAEAGMIIMENGERVETGCVADISLPGEDPAP